MTTSPTLANNAPKDAHATVDQMFDFTQKALDAQREFLQHVATQNQSVASLF